MPSAGQITHKVFGDVIKLINPKNETRLKEHFKEQFPKLEPTKDNIEMFRQILKNDANTIQNSFGLMLKKI